MADQLSLGGIADHRPPPVGFSCVLADPPWLERGGGGRGAQNHYDLMSTRDIVRLPVVDVVASNAHLWLWTTDNYLLAGLEAMGAWGFRYVRTFCWAKVKNGAAQFGIGQYARGAHELCLFGVRGRLPIPPAARLPSLWLAERVVHSAKPECSYVHIETSSPGARLELFARRARPGWHALGNETEGGDIRQALVRLGNNRAELRRLTQVDDLDGAGDDDGV